MRGGTEGGQGGFQGGWWLKEVAGPSDKVNELWKAPKPGTSSQNLKQEEPDTSF